MGDQLSMDVHSMNLGEPAGPSAPAGEELPLPKISLARDKVLEEARKAASGEGTKPVVSLVVIGENTLLVRHRFALTLLSGHVDAGKSTMMGRLLYELGQVEEKKRNANERNANKTGKASFSWAWEMDSGEEERERSAQNANTPIAESDSLPQRHHDRYCSIQPSLTIEDTHHSRCTRPQRFCAQHDLRGSSSRLRTSRS